MFYKESSLIAEIRSDRQISYEDREIMLSNARLLESVTKVNYSKLSSFRSSNV
jgi:hypothetical protein